MADLFSKDWMKAFAEAWNAEPELSGELEKINFNSVIGYGFLGEDEPRGVLVVENGKAVLVCSGISGTFRTDPTRSLIS